MATTFTTTEKASRDDTFRVSPADVADGVNSRLVADPEYATDVEALAVDIFLNGQLQPVEARREADKTLTLNFGFHRKDAVARIREGFDATDPTTGKPIRVHDPEARLWVKVVTGVSQDEAFVRGVRENLASTRHSVTDLQEAKQHEHFRTALGWTDTQIARFYGYTNQNRVMALNKLLTYDAKLQTLVHTGRLALYTLLDTKELSAEERAKVVEGATDGKGRVQGAVARSLIRDILEARAVSAGKTPDESTPPIKDEPETTEGKTGGDEGKDEAKKTIKRSLKELKNLLAEADERDDLPAAVKDFIGTLDKWIAGKRTSATLWTKLYAMG